MSTHITGIGCSLLDQIYKAVDFSSSTFRKYRSIIDNDGGLQPGKLVFADNLESFSGEDFSDIILSIAGDRAPDAVNLGGPGIVASIHASQLLAYNDQISIRFFGVVGSDDAGKKMLSIVAETPLNQHDLITLQGDSPSTIVLSDPMYHDGHGERCFINNLGTANDLTVEDIPKGVLAADIVFFGGTALVPKIHDALSQLLTLAKEHHALTMVSTVYDFRNQQKDASHPWPMVSHMEDFSKIDLLVMDREEALRISGTKTIKTALSHFKDLDVGAVIISHGAKAVHLYAAGSPFIPIAPTTLPISQAIDEVLDRDPACKGDTTGCGDTLAGGILASIADQTEADRNRPIDLLEAVSWGIVSGGYTCLYMGGTYIEENPGEKLRHIFPYYREYLKQIDPSLHISRHSFSRTTDSQGEPT